MILNKTPDTNIIILPRVKKTKLIIAYEIGRVRKSLKIIKVIMEKTIPKKSIKIPGIPRYFKGCLIIIISIKEAKTPPACKTGFFVEVLFPVSYRTVTFSYEIFNHFSEA